MRAPILELLKITYPHMLQETFYKHFLPAVRSSSVVFRESVRKNARDCFEKKGFAGTANFGYLEAIKCHFEARKGKFGQILSRIQSNFIFCPLYLAVKGPCRKSSLSRNSKYWEWVSQFLF